MAGIIPGLSCLLYIMCKLCRLWFGVRIHVAGGSSGIWTDFYSTAYDQVPPYSGSGTSAYYIFSSSDHLLWHFYLAGIPRYHEHAYRT